MTRKHSTKKALISALLSLVLCISMLLGTTFAWFTDSVTSGSNIIQSGNLDIVLEYWDGDSWEDAEGAVIPFVAADGRDQSEILWEPGATYNMAPFRVRNVGSLSAKVLITINGISGDAKLLEVIDFKTNINNIPDSVLNGTAGDQFRPLEDAQIDISYGMPEGNVISDWVLAPKDATLSDTGHTDVSPEFTVSGHMAETAGNEYMDLSIEGISITVLATQQAYEADSFSELYDENATFPNVSAPVDIPTEDVAAPVVLSAEGMNVEIPAEVINALPDEVKSIRVVYSDPVAKNNELFFSGIELVDQNANEIDLTANTAEIDVTLPAQTTFAAGEVVFIYHDNVLMARATVDANGVISYKATHFCEVVVSDTMTVSVKTAEDLIDALTDIRTEAKKQIPGENGNKQYRENAVFVLENDIVVDSADSFMYTDSNGAPFHFYGVKGVLDLNGHSITVTENALLAGKAYANAVLLVQYSNLEIVGDGSIIAENKSIPVYGWANGSIDIYGGTYITNASERNESAVYVNNSSMLINVYGGNYMDTAYAFNTHDTSCKATSIILHEGITFTDYLKSGTVDVIASDLNNGRIAIADGCEIVKTDAVNTVVKK